MLEMRKVINKLALCVEGKKNLINESAFLRGEDERMQGVNEKRNKMLVIELDWKVNVFSLNQSNLLLIQVKRI